MNLAFRNRPAASTSDSRSLPSGRFFARLPDRMPSTTLGQSRSMNTRVAGSGGSPRETGGAFIVGWSSWLARKAHNLEVAGSNPAPTTEYRRRNLWPAGLNTKVRQ
jgi:hypothetical protein